MILAHERTEEGLAPALARVREAFALAAARTGVAERYVEIAGHTLHLRFAGGGLEERLFPALAHRRVEARPSGLTLGLWDSASAGVALPPVASAVFRRRPGCLFAATDGAVAALDLTYRGFSILDTREGLGFFQVADPSHVPAGDLALPLRSLFNWWLRARSLQLVHAAAVGTEHGAVLLAGPGGAGKSNTALACFADGMRYAGDDYVVVGSEPRARVYGLYRTGKLHAADLRHFPSSISAAASPGRCEGDKSVLYLVAREPASLALEMRLLAIVLPRLTAGSETRLVPAARAESLKAMAPTTLLSLPGAGRGELALLARLASRLPSFALELGSERSRIPAVLRDLLARLATEEGERP